MSALLRGTEQPPEKRREAGFHGGPIECYHFLAFPLENKSAPAGSRGAVEQSNLFYLSKRLMLVLLTAGAPKVTVKV
jgi:hypothetical protein